MNVKRRVRRFNMRSREWEYKPEGKRPVNEAGAR